MKPPSMPSKSSADESADGKFSASVEEPDDITLTIGAIPKRTIAGKHDARSDANETIDGLNDTDELTRHIVEDLPSGSGESVDDIPVIDRGETLPHV